jgi:hypothetical protein
VSVDRGRRREPVSGRRGGFRSLCSQPNIVAATSHGRSHCRKTSACLDGVIASNLASAIKTRLVYQHCPDSQEEVDEIAKRLGLIYRVIYDH